MDIWIQLLDIKVTSYRVGYMDTLCMDTVIRWFIETRHSGVGKGRINYSIYSTILGSYSSDALRASVADGGKVSKGITSLYIRPTFVHQFAQFSKKFILVFLDKTIFK